MKRKRTCPYCKTKTEIEYANVLREHHRIVTGPDGRAFHSLCPCRTTAGGMNCPHCGCFNPKDEGDFCLACGEPLSERIGTIFNDFGMQAKQ